MDFRSFIDNPVNVAKGQGFAAIIGLSPSKGARSPILWNAAYQAMGLPARMVPLDVTADKLHLLLEALDDDATFVGGAVAMPYKQDIARWLGVRLTDEANKIGAVNCLFRRDGKLWGTNTDGEGALGSLTAILDNLGSRHAVLIGLGGAGRAVAAYVAARVASLTALVRDPAAHRDFAASLGIDLNPIPEHGNALGRGDLVINCTTVGNMSSVGTSPLTAAQVAGLPSGTLVFDIIYDPAETALLQSARQRGLATLNGSDMNLRQAVLGFLHANPGCDAGQVASAMDAARRQIA